MPVLRRVAVLLGVLALPVALAIGSQALAARPGAPELEETTPVTVTVTPDASPTAPAGTDGD